MNSASESIKMTYYQCVIELRYINVPKIPLELGSLSICW